MSSTAGSEACAIHRFLFTAAAGEAVYFETSGCAQGALIWRLFDTDGKPIPAYRQHLP
jgi:hypothetical protein